MRWVKVDNMLALQWKYNKVVSMLTTIDKGHEYVFVNRKAKGEWEMG